MEFQTVPPVPPGFEELNERRDDVVLVVASYDPIEIIGIPRPIANQFQTGPLRSPAREAVHVEGSQAFEQISLPCAQDEQLLAGAVVLPPGFRPLPGKKDRITS